MDIVHYTHFFLPPRMNMQSYGVVADDDFTLLSLYSLLIILDFPSLPPSVPPPISSSCCHSSQRKQSFPECVFTSRY